MPIPAHIRVMIVEDDTNYQEIVQQLLSLDQRFQIVCVASSGEEALAKLANASPDLVLVDFQLLGINGLETAKRVKKECPEVKIAMITATVSDYSEAIFGRYAKEAHIQEVIPKSSLTLERIQQLFD